MEKKIVLMGEFVSLRPLVVEDAEQTFHWRQSHRASLLNKGADTVQQQANWITSRPDTEYNFIIEIKCNRPVGMLSLVDIDNVNHRAETARFLIGDEDAVKGVPVAVEAMKLLYELAFDVLKLQRLYGTVAADNHLMIKWQKYLGMKEEGRLRQHYFVNGRQQDAVFLGLLHEEYLSITLPRMLALIVAGRSSNNNAK